MKYGYINLVKKEDIVYENSKISSEGKHQLPLIFKYLFNQSYHKSACINKTKYIIYIGRNRVGSGRRADFIVAKTFGEFGEVMLTLECIQQYKNGNERIPNKLLGHQEGWTVIVILFLLFLFFANRKASPIELCIDISLTSTIGRKQKISLSLR